MDVDALLAALGQVVVLAMIIERALAFVFELRFVPPRKKPPANDSNAPLLGDMLGSTLKAATTLSVSWLLCWGYDFEVMTPLFGAEANGALAGWNTFLTALLVAGGSAGAIKLFQDVLGWSKKSRDASIQTKQAQANARLVRARAALARSRRLAGEAE